MSLIISHTHAEGTLIGGTHRGDGSAEVLKAVINPYTGRGAWRWSRNLGSWYLPRSRYSRANMAVVAATKKALEAAGFVVAVEVDDTYRSAAQVQADAVVRQEERVAALDAKADRQVAAASAAWETEQRAVDALPPGGEPIKIGHHSERRHRKAIERAHAAMRKAIDATDAAKTACARADAAARTTAYRYSAAVVRRRIQRLEAELRRFERARDGYTRTVYVDTRGVKHVETFEAATGTQRDRLLTEIARLEDQIGYWKVELAKAANAGAQLWDAATVAAGDEIRYWGGWGTVVKVNAQSVRLAGRAGRLPFDQITAVRTATGHTVRIVNGARSIDNNGKPPNE